MVANASLTGWYAGLIVGLVAVFGVAVLVVVILRLAQGIAVQNRDVAATIGRIRANTSAIPGVAVINTDAAGMTRDLRVMRDLLAGSTVVTGRRG